MSARLPITAVLPMRNEAELLPGHIVSMNAWVHRVQEVLIVDSESTDGSVELAQSLLDNVPVRVLQRPPGLYAAWNEAAAAIRTPWMVYATVADPLAAPGIDALYDAATGLDVDVVASPVDLDIVIDGKQRTDIRWPLEMVIEAAGITKPLRLTPKATWALTAWYGAFCPYGCAGFLGSLHACLIRPEVLRARPWPTEHGSIGDAVWTARHLSHLRFALVPEAFGTWRFTAASASRLTAPESPQNHVRGGARAALDEHEDLPWVRTARKRLDAYERECDVYMPGLRNAIERNQGKFPPWWLRPHVVKRWRKLRRVVDAIDGTRDFVLALAEEDMPGVARLATTPQVFG